MNYEQAYQAYNSALPDALRQEIFHGGRDRFHQACKHSAWRVLEKRFHDLLRSICVWRHKAPYPQPVKTTMLEMLSLGLLQARQAALRARQIALFGHGGNGAANQHDIG